jgi:IclR helix-turn-helix domain
METNHPSLHTLTAIQTNLPMKAAYTLDELAHATGKSKPTAYRYLAELEQSGFVIAHNTGVFSLRDSIFLPATIIPHIIPSLHALKQAKRFRLHNGKFGVAKAKKLLGELSGMATLDYAAYEITGYQTPDIFYFYPDLFERAVQLLRANNYVESPKGPHSSNILRQSGRGRARHTRRCSHKPKIPCNNKVFRVLGVSTELYEEGRAGYAGCSQNRPTYAMNARM